MARRLGPGAALAIACAALVGVSCGPTLRQPPGAPSLAELERAYAGLREAGDTLDALEAQVPGAGGSRPRDAWRRAYVEHRRAVALALDRLSLGRLSAEDMRAAETIRRALARDLPELSAEEDSAAEEPRPRCEPSASSGLGFEALAARLYACFGDASTRIPFEGRTIDRLTALGELARMPESPRRRALFLAMAPVWRAVNGDGGVASPYRRLVALAASGSAGDGPAAAAARGLGIDPAAAERWLVLMLEAWRDAVAPEPVEPWDFRFLAGEASRGLSSAIPRHRLREVNDRYYRDLGADPSALRIVYDLWPRPGKSGVAYTTFLVRGSGAAGEWRPAVARVSATYAEGGFDNLAELLHESGHAVHLAAVRTRPAFEDWPDSDVLTEAWADVPGFEVYEAAWQRKYLGIEAPIAASLRAKYASVMLDVAWGLFEIRMLRDPHADPDVVWTDITSTYLHVVAHPEWSWWAVRGQLVDSPGYMLNYALGAAVTADLRARIALLRGPFTTGDAGWYAWVSERLLRFGLERPARDVLASFLGRPPSPDALVGDLRRLGG